MTSQASGGEVGWGRDSERSRVFGWGSNRFGQVGEQTTQFAPILRTINLPSKLCCVSDIRVALLMRGGQLGLGATLSHVAVPQEVPCDRQLAISKAAEGEAVPGGSRAVKVICGALHSAVLTGGPMRAESSQVETLEVETLM